ncbi:MAG: hypothetical protein NT018_10935 [Armatimonadetes bacterium]|nr:hypothetical protein [Armatimonadota bacterium]
MKFFKAAALVLLISPSLSHASAPILMVDGVRVRSTPPPIIRNGRVFVPVNFFRKLGLGTEVKSTTRAKAFWPSTDVIYDFKAGRSWVPGDMVGSRIKLSASPFVWRKSLMVPLREVMGNVFQWNARGNIVRIQREKGWLRWRLDDDEEIRKFTPDWYSTPVRPKKPIFLPKHTMARAEKLDAQGDWRGAIQLLQSMRLGDIQIRQYPKDWEGYFNLGIAEAIDAKYAEAQTRFRQAAEISPRNADIQWAIGWAILRKENAPSILQRQPDTLRNAIEYFEKALAIDPNHRKSLSSAGHSYLGLAFLVNRDGGYTEESRAEAKGYLSKAADLFEQLIALGSHGSAIHDILTDINAQLGR